jgi:hypothetical protein
MIVFKSKDYDNTQIQINICEDGIYIELSRDSNDPQDFINYIIPNEEIEELYQVLKVKKDG